MPVLVCSCIVSLYVKDPHYAYFLRSQNACYQFEQLTDFGLSKVGLIDSTDDLSGPAVSGTSLMEEDEPPLSALEHQQERREKRSAVGTPDYLAPEILLGTGHGLCNLFPFVLWFDQVK